MRKKEEGKIREELYRLISIGLNNGTVVFGAWLKRRKVALNNKED